MVSKKPAHPTSNDLLTRPVDRRASSLFKDDTITSIETVHDSNDRFQVAHTEIFLAKDNYCFLKTYWWPGSETGRQLRSLQLHEELILWHRESSGCPECPGA